MDQKKKAKNLSPLIRVGKKGMNDSIIIEIEKLLKKRDLIKIKILNNCPDNIEMIIPKVIDKTDAELVQKIGNTFTIYKKRKK